MNSLQPDFFCHQNRKLAFLQTEGEGMGIVWLGGLRSDMYGTKAQALAEWAQRHNRSFLRFDYSGHGASSGQFEEGTISMWLADALAIIKERLPQKPFLLVGSSMGGWIALLLGRHFVAQGQADLLHGMVLLAPAPDFTSDLLRPKLSDEAKNLIETQGFYAQQSVDGDTPIIITKALLDDGDQNRVLNGLIPIACPVYLIQGMCDEDVPYSHTLKLMQHLQHSPISLCLVPDGDHRLSSQQNIALIIQTVEKALA